MKCKALETIRNNGMLRSGHVLAAVSGGADSVSMLHLLRELQPQFGYTLEAAHVNHGLRGEEADRDEQFVRELCEAWNIPLHVLHADVAAVADKEFDNIEARGRRIRYDYFAELAKGEIATAHTCDDNAETVLLHMMRGSGLHGLCGIAPVRGNVIRPLLDCSRADVEAYCAEHGLSYVTDSTNADDAFARNRVRHVILPAMRVINPAATDMIVRCASTLRTDEDYLTAQTNDLIARARRTFGYDAAVLSAAHPALQKRVIASILSAAMLKTPQRYRHKTPEERHVEACRRLLETGGAVQTDWDTILCVYGGTLYVRKQERGFWSSRIEGDTAVVPFGRIKIQKLSAEMIQKIHKEQLPNCLCCDTIPSDVFFRCRRIGDRITRVNGSGRKEVRRLLQEQGVPACYRNDVAVLAYNDHVIWVEGIGCDKAYAITPQSKSAWYITVIREEKNE